MPLVRPVFYALLALWLAACATDAEQSAPCEDCNVLIVSIDTLRPDRVGLYGYQRPTTPRIDAFFREYSIFDQTSATAPCTAPTVQQFLHGRYAAEGSSLAQILRGAGYRTAAIASQHQFWHDKATYQKGFDHWDLQGRDEVDQHDMTTRRAADVTDAATAWLTDHGHDRFFLWLHYFDPHDPYDPPEGAHTFDRRTGDRLADGDRRALQKPESNRRGVPWYTIDDIFSHDDRARLSDRYDSEIRYVDDHLGRVFDTLDQRDLTDETLVVLLSDHGERLGEDELWGHCITAEEVELRVPLLVRVPGHPDLFTPRMRWQRSSTIDVAPTVVDLLGVPGNGHDFDGDTLRSEQLRYALSAFRDQVAISRGPHKLQCRMTDDHTCTATAFTHVDRTLEEPPADRHNPAYRMLQEELERRRGIEVRGSTLTKQSLGWPNGHSKSSRRSATLSGERPWSPRENGVYRPR